MSSLAGASGLLSLGAEHVYHEFTCFQKYRLSPHPKIRLRKSMKMKGNPIQQLTTLHSIRSPQEIFWNNIFIGSLSAPLRPSFKKKKKKETEPQTKLSIPQSKILTLKDLLAGKPKWQLEKDADITEHGHFKLSSLSVKWKFQNSNICSKHNRTQENFNRHCMLPPPLPFFAACKKKAYHSHCIH